MLLWESPPSLFNILAETWRCAYHFLWRMAPATAMNSVTQRCSSYKVIAPCTTAGCWVSSQQQAGCCILSPPPTLHFTLRVKSPQNTSKKLDWWETPLQPDLYRVARILLFGTESETEQRLCVCVFVLIKMHFTHCCLSSVHPWYVENMSVIWLAHSEMRVTDLTAHSHRGESVYHVA